MKIEHTPREVLERKLLDALEDMDKVAILATEQDLQMLIGALTLWKKEPRRDNMLRGLEALYREAFGKE